MGVQQLTYSGLVLMMVASMMLIGADGEEGQCSSKDPVFFDTFPLDDFHIRIYRRQQDQDSGRIVHNKYYYAPLALLDHSSAVSVRNELTGEHQMTFSVEMWTEELQQRVEEYLRNATAGAWNSVGILPFEKVVIRCAGCMSSTSGVRLAAHWHSLAQSPKRLEFRLVCSTERQCRHLADKMKQEPQHFSPITLHFLLPAKSSQQQTRRKTASITSQHVFGGRVMADISAQFTNHAFVTRTDRERIISETFDNIVADQIDDDSIINPEDEYRWKRQLDSLIFESHIVPLLDAEAADVWDSVYWRSDNARPDLLSSKLNKIYQTADEKDQGLISQLAEGVAIQAFDKIMESKTLAALANALQTIPKLIASNLTPESRLALEWNGISFIPKLPQLFRINLEKLRNNFKTVASVSTKYFVPDLSLDLIIKPEMTQRNFDRKPSIPENGDATVESNEQQGNGGKELEAPSKGFFQTIRGAITGGGLEIAPYTVERTAEEGYEERLYPARKWVKTQAKHVSRDAASSTMFWKLFNYISGKNDKQVKIAMTGPVSVLIEPGSGPNCESTFTMAFYVPAEFQEDTPVPTEDDVTIEERPEVRVFARRYGGFSNDVTTKQEHDNLWNSLSDTDKETVDQAGPYYFAGYDPPFKLFFRRNEIWMFPKEAAPLLISSPGTNSNDDEEREPCEPNASSSD